MHYLAALLITLLVASPVIAADVPPRDSVISITAVGDIMMGTTFPEPKLPPSDGAGIFDNVKAHFADSDIVFGNLEGPLFDGEAEAKCKDPSKTCYAFKTPTRYAAYLVDAGFSALGIANNHASDFGIEGRTSTLKTLQESGIQAVGGKAEASFEIRGKRVAIAGFSYSDNPYSHSVFDIPVARDIVRRLKADHDLVLVSFHAGAEGRGALHIPGGMETFLGEDRGDVTAFSHAVVDAGADLVIGHGPHVVRALEVYKEKLIAYSLGNFLTYERFNLDGPSGRSFILKVKLDATTGDLAGGELIPVRLMNEGIPGPDPEHAAVKLARTLTREDMPETGLVIAKDGGLSVQSQRPQKAKKSKPPVVPAVAQKMEETMPEASTPPTQPIAAPK